MQSSISERNNMRIKIYSKEYKIPVQVKRAWYLEWIKY